MTRNRPGAGADTIPLMGRDPRLERPRIIAALRCAIGLASVLARAAALIGFQDLKAGDANREPYQSATRLIDVGAGAGYYSMRIAGLVGPDGNVIAEDISDSSMRWLNLAAVLIVDSYHHFTAYPAMLDKILHALKPGGRLGNRGLQLPRPSRTASGGPAKTSRNRPRTGAQGAPGGWLRGGEM